MKNGKKLHELQEDYTPPSEMKCCVCGKPMELPYGRWGDGGTCSRVCERVQEAKPKYQGASDEKPA